MDLLELFASRPKMERLTDLQISYETQHQMVRIEFYLNRPYLDDFRRA